MEEKKIPQEGVLFSAIWVENDGIWGAKTGINWPKNSRSQTKKWRDRYDVVIVIMPIVLPKNMWQHMRGKSTRVRFEPIVLIKIFSKSEKVHLPNMEGTTVGNGIRGAAAEANQNRIKKYVLRTREGRVQKQNKRTRPDSWKVFPTAAVRRLGHSVSLFNCLWNDALRSH